MSQYELFSDSTLDLTDEVCKQQNIHVIPMDFNLDTVAYTHYCDQRQLSVETFYQKMREGAESTTSQINYSRFYKHFEKVLKEEKDILYICFSSGLSGTYNTSLIAVADLKEKYPNRTILVVDSLSASIGEGVLLYNAAMKKQDGYTLEQLYDWALANRTKACHWFVVDDLDHLKKGGRIGSVAATFGKALQIKPLLSVDDEGKLTTVAKLRGSKKINDELLSRLVHDGENTEEQTVVIGHADNIEQANTLSALLRSKKLVQKVLISDIGPIIGTHTGSGMLALAFMGKRSV